MSKKRSTGNNNKRKMNWKKLFNESVIIPSLISIVAFVFSVRSDNKSFRVESLAKDISLLVSTQQYQISQNMYGELLRLQKVLDDIADLASGADYGFVDVSNEIDVLREIRGTAAYAIMETLIQYESYDFKNNIRNMAKNGNQLSARELYKCAKHTIEIMKSNNLYERVEDYQNRVSNLNGGNSIKSLSYTNDNNKDVEKQDKNEKSLVLDSKNEQNTDQSIVSSDKFLAFVYDKAITTEQIKDPDLLYYYGIMNDDKYLISLAIDYGADVNVTEAELIARYSKEYEDFYKEYNYKEHGPNKFNLWEFIEDNIVVIILMIVIVILSMALIIIHIKNNKISNEKEKLERPECEGNKVENSNNAVVVTKEIGVQNNEPGVDSNEGGGINEIDLYKKTDVTTNTSDESSKEKKVIEETRTKYNKTLNQKKYPKQSQEWSDKILNDIEKQWKDY